MTVSLLSHTSSAFACSVCFGDPNSLSSKAVLAAVLFMAGVIVFVLGVIAYHALVWSRRAKPLS